MAIKQKLRPPKKIDFNRWCIEMAMKWPVISTGGMGGASYSQMPRTDSDADIIARANKIRAWVKSA